MCKLVKKQRLLRRKWYSVINRRVRVLEQRGCVEKAGARKTLAGFTVALFQLTSRGYLAMLLDQTDIDSLLEKADEATVLELLATLAKQFDMPAS